MQQASSLREQAERALRIARESTDPMLKQHLESIAAEYIARADDLDRGGADVPGSDPGRDPE